MIGVLALDSALIDITFWTDSAAQMFLGCSMKVCHSESVAEDCNDNLLSTDELQGMTDLVKEREGLVSFITKGSYSKDGKKYINLEDFKWVAK